MLSSPAFAIAPATTRLASSSLSAIAFASIRVLGAIVRIAQNPARQRATMLAILQQDLAIDHGHVDAFGWLTDAHGARGEVVHNLVRQRTYSVRIKDHD